MNAMVRYRIRMTVSYTYPAGASGRHIVRLLPEHLPGLQQLLSGRLILSPVPDRWKEGRDFFGNHFAEAGFTGSHQTINFGVEAEVERVVAAPAASGTGATLAEIKAEARSVLSVAPHSPHHFLRPSTLLADDPAIAAFARDATRHCRTVVDAVEALGRALHAEIAFDSEATTVETPPSAAFAARRGVCQDISHIMIIGLRALGVPAGYVSGFLRTLPPPGEQRLEGVDAMHAWVRAWCGHDVGWIEYDPTNAMPAGKDHVVVSYGRDYADVAP
ncbi:MAG: transglutaminase family protein, partial [Rhizobiaceae bacterium]|nr:transglutaminase family protein [Rhizobiaceae bacterium]